MIEFTAATALAAKLRTRDVVDAKAGHTREPTERELEAAGMLDSLVYQLQARIGVARAEAAEQVGAA